MDPIISLEKKEKIVKLHKQHPNWKFTTLQVHAGVALKKKDYLKRWEEEVKKGGTKFDKSKAIKNFTYAKFCEARNSRSPVTTRNVQEWALQAAQQFRDQDLKFSFIASKNWTNNFKQEFRIHQRKVTRYVKPTEQRSLDDIYRSAENFQIECQQITSGGSDRSLIINTDQMGCEYRSAIDRTLDHVGKKAIEVHIGDVNKVTHSYTVQYSITASGKLLPKVFICLQEPTGKFGPRIQEHINNLQQKYKNISIMCSKSGKLSTYLFKAYLTNVLQPYVGEKKFTLILDSWGGQSKEELFEDFKTSNNEASCSLKYIPPGCTMFCQPLDTYIHRQMKIFIKKLQNSTHLIEHQRQINSRDDAIKIHALLHNQLSAPVFNRMIEYAWFSAKLIEDRDIFCNVNEVCFSQRLDSKCNVCQSMNFIQCSWCRMVLCFSCFYDSYHPSKCTLYFINV